MPHTLPILLFRLLFRYTQIMASWTHPIATLGKKKLCIIKGLQRSCTFNFTALPCFLRNIRHIKFWAELRIFMNSLPLFHTTKINFMHSSYTPRVCRALPCVSELPATELLYIKMYVNKIKHSLNMHYLLTINGIKTTWNCLVKLNFVGNMQFM